MLFRSAKAPPAASGPNVDADQAANDPAAPAIKMVNSKRVTLNYELKDVGASGVSGVELWCKQNDHAWKKGEIVAQTSHSFTVEVKEEGLYGFTLLARNGSGVGQDAPAAGEQPQVWVMVDTTKPTVQIASVEIGHGKTPNVEIHWSAKDKNLGAEPVSIHYRTRTDGPWQVIAQKVKNDGVHRWAFPRDAGGQFFFKVEVTDRAGNVAHSATSQPVTIDMTEPRVTVVGVTGGAVLPRP